MAYATEAELTAHIGTTPADAARLLERASRDIDRALLRAVYDVDENGDPTGADVIAALKEATLEQVAYRLANGETDGMPGGYDQVSIGSVSLSRGRSAAAGGAVHGLGAQAWQILASAGLTGDEAYTW